MLSKLMVSKGKDLDQTRNYEKEVSINQKDKKEVGGLSSEREARGGGGAKQMESKRYKRLGIKK